MSVKNVSYYAFFNEHCKITKFNHIENESDVPRPILDNWARNKVKKKYEPKELSLVETPEKELTDSEISSPQRNSRSSQRSWLRRTNTLGQNRTQGSKNSNKKRAPEDDYHMEDLRVFNTMNKFKIGG